ncbi:hypothetical protein D3C83_103270 [compost metagenome]
MKLPDETLDEAIARYRKQGMEFRADLGIAVLPVDLSVTEWLERIRQHANAGVPRRSK